MANLLFDLGHGGSDPGAVNGSRLEKNDVNIALTVGKKVSSAGHKVDYTRTTDCSLSLAARIKGHMITLYHSIEIALVMQMQME